MSPLEMLFGSVATMTAILGIALPIWRARHRHGLRWAILNPKSMMEIAEEIESEITIHYKDRPIADMTRFQFILHNTGYVPIEKSDIVVPLKWVGPGDVLSARVIAAEPPVDLGLEVAGSTVEFSWPLFNQRCMALVEILCAGGSPNQPGTISGQIRNIPAIEAKRVSVWDENETLKRMEVTTQLTTPRVLQPINRLFLNRWFIRFSRWILPVYLVAFPFWMVWTFVGEGVVPPFALPVTVLASAAAVAGFYIFFLRNPYAHLLKKAEKLKP